MKKRFIGAKAGAGIGLLLLLVISPAYPSQGEPLPEVGEILEKLRRNLRSDRYLLRNYTYNETQEVVELDKNGRPKSTKTTAFEIFPSTVEELTYRRLVSKDGKPVQESKLRKQDREHDKRVQKFAKKARKKGVSVQSQIAAGEEEALLKEERSLDEILRLYEFEVRGREAVDGHPAIVVDFTPRPSYNVRIKDVKPFKKISGRAWISEKDYQLVRIEAQTLKSLKFGLGVIAKLNKGASLVFERRKVNEEIWLPARASFSGTGRILLLKGFRFQARSEYSDYKKFSVGSSVTFDTSTKQ